MEIMTLNKIKKNKKVREERVRVREEWRQDWEYHVSKTELMRHMNLIPLNKKNQKIVEKK